MSLNFELNRDFYWRAFTVLCVIALALTCAESAFASYDSNDVMGNTLCKVTTMLAGNTARAVSTIAIFTTGVSLFVGKMQWTTAAMIAVGIGVIFAAAPIIAFISGSAGSCTTA